eukprot:TRINITY_DN3455_c0_g2_i2.p1 TRINITY_DN3455_c0_g2~~TRINITY_DN3455_c0_g2_i2.p1  ORF type:complete len:290 (-),score=38.79 TRINITY_DN3455_c0_g2_i2:346-1215(-)
MFLLFALFCSIISQVVGQCIVPLVVKSDDSAFRLSGRISSPIEADIKQKNSQESLSLAGVFYLELFDPFCPANLEELIVSLNQNGGRLFIEDEDIESQFITVTPETLRAKVEVGLIKDFASIDISNIQIDIKTNNFTVNEEDGTFRTDANIELVTGQAEVSSSLFDLSENLAGEQTTAVLEGQLKNISGAGVFMLPDLQFSITVQPSGGDIKVNARIDLKGMLTAVIDFEGADEINPTANLEVMNDVDDEAIQTPSPPSSGGGGGFFSNVGQFFASVGRTLSGFFGGLF